MKLHFFVCSQIFQSSLLIIVGARLINICVHFFWSKQNLFIYFAIQDDQANIL